MQVIEMPWAIGKAVRFSGTLWLRGGADAAALAAIELGFKAVTRVGSFKSSGFGQVSPGSWACRADTPAATAVLGLQTLKPAPAYRVVWRLDSAFLVAVKRIAGNIFEGGSEIPGGAIKGALADALVAAGKMTPDMAQLLGRTVFGHARAVAAGALRLNVNSMPLPTPFSVACFEGPDIVAADVLLVDGVPLRVEGEACYSPVFEIDLKDKHIHAINAWRTKRNMARSARLTTDSRVRTAINYDKGTASFAVDTGGGLFATEVQRPSYLGC